jgi:hypothetical protein
LCATVRNTVRIMGCHERETTELGSHWARQNLLLRKGAPQSESGKQAHCAGNPLRFYL